MRQSLKQQQNATIYQYQLIKRFVIMPELVNSHLLVGAMILGLLVLFYQKEGLFAWLIGFVILQVIQLIILLLTFIRVEEAVDRQWIWRIHPPWIGLKPANDLPLRLYRRVHRHLFWIGLCFIGALYPWVSSPIMISMLYWHLWLMFPRLLLSFALRKQKEDGVLRLQTKEASYYHR